MEKQRILVTVKTYPTLSKKYGETVCTAGVKDDGSWVRLYPVPFRRLEEEQRYKKYDWIECQLTKHSSDPRPESYRPVDFNELTPVGHMGTDHDWAERRRLLIETAQVFDSLEELIGLAKNNERSLAVFKPTELLEFTWEDEEREWDPKRLRAIREANSQLELFEDNTWRETVQVIPKLPYSFSYRFRDSAGKESELQILDWEIGALYWNCLRSAEGDENNALAKVRQKYWDEFREKDLHFFLGTTQQFHPWAPNPWVIVGVFPVPFERQPRLL